MSEILAPAGNAKCAAAAIDNGADAIYLGYRAYSARAGAENFDGEALEEILKKAHFAGVKVYVAMNTLVKESETEEFVKTLLEVWNSGADAIIMQDVLLGRFVHERYPDIVLHLSTQAGVCNTEGARFAKKCGFSRVILARETPLAEIEKIAALMETEVFVQGALCTCFSGQCYFSSFAGGNSGNRGKCKQPCRKMYSYDRNGFEERSYALSLSDLCVAEEIEKLRRAGVSSFKIEGRMRRPEYVAAAVRYYRLLLDGGTEKEKVAALSDLKRTYNRGNYTKGLAFGQDKRFLSRAVQGHIGERVGTVKVLSGKYYVEGTFRPVSGDAFKILRNGREAGGAAYVASTERGFYISSSARLLNGDGVFVTTDTAVNQKVLSGEKRIPVSLTLRFCEGENAVAECGDVRVFSEELLSHAQAHPLTTEELESCFLKTDTLPLDVSFEKITLEGEVFLAKSRLNALRRAFYEKLFRARTEICGRCYAFQPIPRSSRVGKNEKTALIASDFKDIENIDVAVFKPDNYGTEPPESFTRGGFEKFIYYPAFASEADLKAVERLLKTTGADGIYAENYGGISFAEDKNVKLFAGTGFNLTNAVAVNELLKESVVAYYAVSKELDEREAVALGGEKAFLLSSGDIKLMDLCYCPFGKTCASCDKKRIYILTDENGRAFPVRRYVSAAGDCRFEVFNCAKLVGRGLAGMGKLLDCSAINDGGRAVALAEDEEAQRAFYGNYTAGHRKKSVL